MAGRGGVETTCKFYYNDDIMRLGLSTVIAWLKLRLRALGNSPSARCFLLLQDVLTATCASDPPCLAHISWVSTSAFPCCSSVASCLTVTEKKWEVPIKGGITILSYLGPAGACKGKGREREGEKVSVTCSEHWSETSPGGRRLNYPSTQQSHHTRLQKP